MRGGASSSGGLTNLINISSVATSGRRWCQQSPIKYFKEEFINSVAACDRETHATRPTSRRIFWNFGLFHCKAFAPMLNNEPLSCGPCGSAQCQCHAMCVWPTDCTNVCRPPPVNSKTCGPTTSSCFVLRQPGIEVRTGSTLAFAMVLQSSERGHARRAGRWQVFVDAAEDRDRVRHGVVGRAVFYCSGKCLALVTRKS